jgi:hypothetical protein
MPHSAITRAGPAATIVVALVLAACSDTTVPQPAENAPQDFEYSVSAPEGGVSTWVQMDGGVVVVTHTERTYGQSPRTRRVRTVPTAGEWNAFWAAVDAAGVQRWTGEYEAEGFRDGTGWSLRLAGNGVSVDSHGTNAWPDRDGLEHHLQMTTDFRAFLDALGGLTGWEF